MNIKDYEYDINMFTRPLLSHTETILHFPLLKHWHALGLPVSLPKRAMIFVKDRRGMFCLNLKAALVTMIMNGHVAVDIIILQDS